MSFFVDMMHKKKDSDRYDAILCIVCLNCIGRADYGLNFMHDHSFYRFSGGL